MIRNTLLGVALGVAVFGVGSEGALAADSAATSSSVSAAASIPQLRTAGYVPETLVEVAGDRRPGGVIAVTFGPGSFTPGEAVIVQTRGSNGSILTKELIAEADGSLRYEFTIPRNGEETFLITATGRTSGNIGTAAVDIVPPDALSGVADDSNLFGLPSTGSENPALIAWVALGVTALSGSYVVATSDRRRRRALRRRAATTPRVAS